MQDALNLRLSAEQLLEDALSIGDNTIPSKPQNRINKSLDFLQGRKLLRRAGTGENFWEFRPFRYGDSSRAIDWRQSAKTDRLVVKEKQKEERQKILCILSQHAGMEYSSEKKYMKKIEVARKILLALALWHDAQGDSFSLQLTRHSAGLQKTHFKNGPSALSECTEFLLETPNAPFNQIHALIPPAATCRQIYIAADFLEDLPAWEAYCLGKSNLTLIQICDPAEIEFPFSGNIIFQSPSADDPEFSASGAQNFATEYRQAFAAHQEHLKALAEKSEVRLLCLRTDMALAPALREILT